MTWLLLMFLSVACASGPGGSACPAVSEGPDKAGVPSSELSAGAEEVEAEDDARALEAEIATLGLPEGRAINALDEERCLELLASNDVEVEVVEDAEEVEMPVRVGAPIGGIQVVHRGRSEVHAVLDCRLVVALLAWSPHLRRAGVTSLVHYSVYRPGAVVRGTRARSGHAAAMAIDVGVFERGEDNELDVVEVWTDRRRGVASCPPPALPEGVDEEPAEQALLRGLVCEAVARDLFQVVLTPHHDEAHENHVHLELRPGVDWTIVE